MEELIRQHKTKFGVEPIILGLYWSAIYMVKENITKAIESNIPYNEEKLLSKEELIAFKSGGLVF